MAAVGFSSNKSSLKRTSRWEQESWAYHRDDGKSFFGENQGRGRDYGPNFTTNNIIGYGVNFSTGCAFSLGIVFSLVSLSIPRIEGDMKEPKA